MHVLARLLRPLAYFLQEPENLVKRPRLTAVQNSDEAAGADPGIFVGGGGYIVLIFSYQYFDFHWSSFLWNAKLASTQLIRELFN